MSTIYRQAFGAPLPVANSPEPVPTVERIPKTIDGCTWYASHPGPDGETIGATGRTKKRALESFSEQWARFA